MHVSSDLPFLPSTPPVLPTPAGLYAYLLGDQSWASDADRQAAELLLAAEPYATVAARENREFITRSAVFAADLGIRQFIDLGAGYPLREFPAIHEIAGEAHVTYADLDPAVVAAWSATLDGSDRATAVTADLRDPGWSLGAVARAGRLDPQLPVAVIFGVVLNFIAPDQVRPVVSRWTELIAPGSCVIISVGRATTLQHGQDLMQTYRAAPTYHPSRQEIRSWFGDLELIDPGMCEARDWRAGTGREDRVRRNAEVWCGVGIKPAAVPSAGTAATTITVPARDTPGQAELAVWNDADDLRRQLGGPWAQVILRYLPDASPGDRPSELLRKINAGLAERQKLHDTVLFDNLRRLVAKGLAIRTAVGSGRDRMTLYQRTASGRAVVEALRRVTVVRAGLALPGLAPGTGDDSPVPHIARVYDCCLGGANFAGDAETAREFLEVMPSAVRMLEEGHAFTRRAIRALTADHGITQVISIGAGLPPPAGPALHEAAWEHDPQTRWVYLDRDPVVVTRLAQVLASVPGTLAAVARADLREPVLALNFAATAGPVDLSRPVAIILAGVLQCITEAEDPAGIIRRLMDAAPPGSYLVVSHPATDAGPAAEPGAAALNRRLADPVTFRSRAALAGMLEGLDLLSPGLVQYHQWRPGGSPPGGAVAGWCAVARRP
jgi:O-methyltransferase involved in polyketide biosynthesis/DNA-binding HxlR family transcriptional regulator